MDKILITGGAGFIAYHLAKRLLERGSCQIDLLDNFSRGQMDEELRELLSSPRVDFIEGDLCDGSTFRGLSRDYTHVYHLAAIIGVKNVMEKPHKVLYVNSTSILNLLEWLPDLERLRKLLFSSTSEIYAGTLANYGIEVPTNERVPLVVYDIESPRTSYGLSKMLGESACFNYGAQYGIPFTIVRYHNVYGPRMGYAHVVPETFIKVGKNSRVEVPSANHSRAFCYVDDAVEMTIRACESEKTASEILHIGKQDEEIPIKELVRLIAKVMGRDIEVLEMPPTEGSPARRCPDTSKIEKMTGYSPQVGLEEGLRRCYEWYEDRIDDRVGCSQHRK